MKRQNQSYKKKMDKKAEKKLVSEPAKTKKKIINLKKSLNKNENI